MKSVITLNATLSMDNTNATTHIVRPSIAEEDFLQLNNSDVTDSAGNDIGNRSISKAYGADTIPAGGTATLGPTNAFTNFSMFNDSLDRNNSLLSDFVGSGTVPLEYTTYAGFGLSGQGSGVTVNPTFAVTTNFSMTYYICNPGTLSANILNFTATLENPRTVAVAWLTTNETPGQQYNVQVSSGNGTDFSNLDTVIANGPNGNGNYAYNYPVQATDHGDLYFRLKVTDETGNVYYSPLRVISLVEGNDGVFSIFPNPPSDFINISLPGASQNWSIEIYAADGKLVQQNYFPGTNLINLSFNRKMAAGAYFVRAISVGTGKTYSSSFIINNNN